MKKIQYAILGFITGLLITYTGCTGCMGSPPEFSSMEDFMGFVEFSLPVGIVLAFFGFIIGAIVDKK